MQNARAMSGGTLQTHSTWSSFPGYAALSNEFHLLPIGKPELISLSLACTAAIITVAVSDTLWAGAVIGIFVAVQIILFCDNQPLIAVWVLLIAYVALIIHSRAFILVVSSITLGAGVLDRYKQLVV